MRPRLLALTLLAAQAASLPAQSPPASLTYLANMGVLLDCGGRRVTVTVIMHATGQGAEREEDRGENEGQGRESGFHGRA